MRSASSQDHLPSGAPESVPVELLTLREQVRSLPEPHRRRLEPIVDEAVEQAWFRGRVLSVARDALEQMRLELEMARFDLEVTRREHEALRRRTILD